MRIAFVGSGNMTMSLAGGLRAAGVPGEEIVVADPVPGQVTRLVREHDVRGAAGNAEAASGADVVVLAVKPQDMAAAAAEIAPALARRSVVVVSIAAGIRLASLAGWLGSDTAIVRSMPNRPALIGAGITAAVANERTDAPQRGAAERVLAAAGSVVWLDDERLLDAVTAVSGSGPAYFFLLMEAIEAAGTSLGLPATIARQLAVQTALGAGRMAAEGSDPPAALREQVTSTGGTTAAALAVLEGADLRGIFDRAIAAAARRSAELADQFGGR
jgi:pyrroline-5-carboxylate reductase